MSSAMLSFIDYILDTISLRFVLFHEHDFFAHHTWSAFDRNGNAQEIPVAMGRQKCCKQQDVRTPFVNTDRIASKLQLSLTATG
jgi:hypothetical protein